MCLHLHVTSFTQLLSGSGMDPPFKHQRIPMSIPLKWSLYYTETCIFDKYTRFPIVVCHSICGFPITSMFACDFFFFLLINTQLSKLRIVVSNNSELYVFNTFADEKIALLLNIYKTLNTFLCKVLLSREK